jgi:hypothetical protein
MNDQMNGLGLLPDMRSPFDVLLGRVNGLTKAEVARRTVPCYKYVLDDGEEERLEVCLLVDSKYLYRYPYEKTRGIKSLAIKAGYLKGDMEHLLLREFQPGICRYVQPRSQKTTA